MKPVSVLLHEATIDDVAHLPDGWSVLVYDTLYGSVSIRKKGIEPIPIGGDIEEEIMNRYYTTKGEVSEREAKEIEKRNKEITSKPLSGEWLKVRFILKADTERPEQWGGTANRRHPVRPEPPGKRLPGSLPSLLKRR